jgi:hypothetical protein
MPSDKGARSKQDEIQEHLSSIWQVIGFLNVCTIDIALLTLCKSCVFLTHSAPHCAAQRAEKERKALLLQVGFKADMVRKTSSPKNLLNDLTAKVTSVTNIVDGSPSSDLGLWWVSFTTATEHFCFFVEALVLNILA